MPSLRLRAHRGWQKKLSRRLLRSFMSSYPVSEILVRLRYVVIYGKAFRVKLIAAASRLLGYEEGGINRTFRRTAILWSSCW